MPCDACCEMFYTSPCRSEISEIKLKMEYYPKTFEIIELLYKSLKKSCPCQMCVVRPICKTKCDKYNDLLDRI